MRDVLNQAASELVLACRREGLRELGPLFRGLPFDERSLARRPFGRIDWDPYSLLVDRIAERLGGPESMQQVGRRVYREQPMVTALLRLVVSPKNAYRLAESSIGPWFFPHIQHRWRFLPGDRLQLHYELPAEARGSLAFWYVLEAAECAVPAYLGLAEATSQVEARTPHRFATTLQLPPSQTIATRLLPSEALVRSIVLQWGERLEEQQTWTAEVEQSLEGRARLPFAQARRDWRLTPRESQAVELALEGLSNQQIASRLACSRGTVESHLSRAFKKARVDGRTQLMNRLLPSKG
ncbi:MAG: helix-turn-helix transcriptional regulator [Deltaproteobacteria bacterium]